MPGVWLPLNSPGDPATSPQDGDSCMHLACEKGHTAIAEWLHSRGQSDPRAIDYVRGPGRAPGCWHRPPGSRRDRRVKPPLLTAAPLAAHRRPAQMGETNFLVACRNGHTELAKRLLGLGYDMHAKNMVSAAAPERRGKRWPSGAPSVGPNAALGGRCGPSDAPRAARATSSPRASARVPAAGPRHLPARGVQRRRDGPRRVAHRPGRGPKSQKQGEARPRDQPTSRPGAGPEHTRQPCLRRQGSGPAAPCRRFRHGSTHTALLK